MAGQLDDAKTLLDLALGRNPDHADAHLSRAMLYLEQGNFAFGFAEYEWRWQCNDFPGREIVGTEWRGEDLAGKTILVHAEQGLGDTIQFARFVPMLLARGASILFYAQPELVPVLETLEGDVRIIPAETAVPNYDYYVAVMSLPYHLGIMAEAIPAEIPYLSAPKTVPDRLEEILPPESRHLRVGLTWAGRPTHADDRHRSCPLEALLPLARVPGVALYALQKEMREEDKPFLTRIKDLSPHLDDFGVTAAALSRLDLIVAVDTATAHLAGALGRPVMLMLAHRAEWRWALGQEDSPWYPTMRLVRQPTPGDWETVVSRIADSLKRGPHRKA